MSSPRPTWHPAPSVRPFLLVLLVVASVAACTGAPGPSAGDPSSPATPTPTAPPVRVVSGPEPEPILLAHVLAELLRASDIPAEVVERADAEAARRALELGDVDVGIGYTGEAWLQVLGRADPPSDPRTSFARVREFDEREGLLWQRPTFARNEAIDAPPADATFAFVSQGPPSIYADLRTMSQLARELGQDLNATLCVDPEFLTRPDGYDAVVDAYDIRGGVRVFEVAPSDAVLGVAAGDCVAGLTTATDGDAWLRGQRPLIDDLGVFPAFVVAAVVRDDARPRWPGLLAAVAPFGNGLTTERLGMWNARVALGEPVEEVAVDAAFDLLVLAGRLPEPRPTGTEATPEG